MHINKKSMSLASAIYLLIFNYSPECKADLVAYAEPISAYKASVQTSMDSPKVIDTVSAMVIGKTKSNYHMNIVAHIDELIDMSSTPVINLPNSGGTTVITTNNSKSFTDSSGNTYVGSPIINGNVNGNVFLITAPPKN